MSAIRLYHFFQRHRPLLLMLVLCSVIAMGWFSSRLRLEEDITKFIPRDRKINEVNFILQNLKIKDKIIVHLYHADTATAAAPEDLMQCADRLADTLLKTHKNYIKDLNYKVSDDVMMRTYDVFYRHLPIFLEENDYPRIAANLEADSLKQRLKSNYQTLLSPSGVVLGRFIQRDPLSLTALALQKMQNLQLDENFEVNQGYIQTKDLQHLLLFITPAVDPNKNAENKAFLRSLDGIIAGLEKDSENQVIIEYYGSAPVTLGNSEQVHRDSILTSSIAIAIILLLLFLFFRRVFIILYILLPVAFGALFSLAVLSFLKDELSAIALGAGSIVIGIAINYSLHFFTHFKHERSVEKVLKDLTLPMLTGCVTTVGAFLSLQYTKSVALHDFGLFAGFSLIGAVLFSLVVLPHLLKRQKEKPAVEIHRPSFLDKLLSYNLDKNKPIVLLALLLTILFAFTARHVGFESDMMRMNYQNKKLLTAERHLNEINKFSLSSVYVVSKGKDLEAALKANERAAALLETLRKKGIIDKYSSASSLLVSDSLQKLRIARWNAFWTRAKKDSLKKHLVEEGLAYKFKKEAFDRFYEQLYTDFAPVPLTGLDTLKKLIVNDWITERKDLSTVLNMVKVEPALKQQVYSAFEGQRDILVFDRQYLTTQFIDIISSDFTLILTITAFLVFGFMLLSHGRIEVAIINFLPMFISWLWILGIMSLLGLKFNIINIIISTFIFGLGDDYSIFIMDGLTQEYKYGQKPLMSYKTSIVLSALTNIVGIGVLAFAKHPALRSIASITIIGMLTVLFISFIVQPLFYNFLILNRTKKGLLPYTGINLLITLTGFLLFLAGSLAVTTIGLLLFSIVPARLARKKVFFHTLIQYFCRYMLRLFVNVKKEIINPQNEHLQKPAVIISNHQSHIDLAMILQLHPKIIVFTNDWVWNSPFYGRIVKMADFYPASQGYEQSLEKVKKLSEQGYSVLIFPESTRSTTGEILRFHKGAFYLAEQLKLDILPVLLHGTGDCLSKGDFYFKEARLTLKFLPRIQPGDTAYGTGYKERSKNICALMRHENTLLRQALETVHYFRPRLVKNYIYKGPVLEWYCRIKLNMEKNYQLFEQLVPKQGRIVDLGCGYGFLPLMLSFTGKDRHITGIDYDEEKIRVAANCALRPERLRFLCDDISTVELPPADSFILSDVLHYLTPEEQVRVIERCIHKLNPGGVMVLRDADSDKKRRHLGTRYTEFFSTNSGFNKTKGKALHFSSAERIRNTLDKFSFLRYELIDNTSLTSNVIFVIRHTGKKQKAAKDTNFTNDSEITGNKEQTKA